MSAFHVIQQALLTAAELVALLFVTPALAAEAALSHRAASTAVHEQHSARAPRLAIAPSEGGRFELRLLGSLAELRWTHALENIGSEPIDLTAWLPDTDETIDALRITRGARSVDLLQAAGGCELDGDALLDHAVLEHDEAIADLLQLPHGETATIEVSAVRTVEGRGKVFRIAAPALPWAAASYTFVTGAAEPMLAVVLPAAAAPAHATLLLTLRRAGAAAETFDLGEAGQFGVRTSGDRAPGNGLTAVFIVPLGAHSDFADLAQGAVELEVRAAGTTHWVTLAPQAMDASAPVHIARSARLARLAR